VAGGRSSGRSAQSAGFASHSRPEEGEGWGRRRHAVRGPDALRFRDFGLSSTCGVRPEVGFFFKVSTC